MKKLILLAVVLSLLPACEKSSDNVTISGHVVKTQYYSSEIFSEANQQIYGKWKFLNLSGGIGGFTYDPSYDYLEVTKYGIYGIIKDNKIKEIGKIIVNQQDDIRTLITFLPDAEYRTDYQLNQRQISFNGNDSLSLWDTYMDGFSALYKRIK